MTEENGRQRKKSESVTREKEKRTREERETKLKKKGPVRPLISIPLPSPGSLLEIGLVVGVFRLVGGSASRLLTTGGGSRGSRKGQCGVDGPKKEVRMMSTQWD